MLLKRRTNPATFLRLAMASLLVFFALVPIARLAPANWQDLLDGVRGAMLGATLTLMALTGMAKRRS